MLTVVAALLIAGLLIGGEHLPDRVRADHAGPGARHRRPAVGAGRCLVLDRPDRRPGRSAASIISWASRQGRARTWLLAVLATAAVLGPLEQARLHTLGLAEQARRPGRLVRRHRRRLRGRPVHRRRPGAAGRAPSPAGPAWSRWPSPSRWAPASPGSSPPTGPTPPASSRSSARWPTTAPAACWSRTPPSPSTTCPPAASGSDGPAPATSSCPRAPAPAARPARPASPAPATRRLRPATSPRGYFSFVALNFADTTALDHAIATDLRHNPHYHIIQVIPYGTDPPSATAPTSSGDTSPASDRPPPAPRRARQPPPSAGQPPPAPAAPPARPGAARAAR